MKFFFVFVFLIFLLSNKNLQSQTEIRKISPIDTDPLISTFNQDSNYVYFNSAAMPLNLLVIHLPGSFGEPKRATHFGTLAADLGFHSIGLMYPNIPTVGSICSASSDPSCFENVRREIVEGVDYSGEIDVNATECILHRIKMLLNYLHTNYPAENWQQFLDENGNLEYPKMIFSGHSQGGGHAALIGKFFPIKRAICFSAPKDWSTYFDSPPSWLQPDGWQLTPSQIYGFNHISDEHERQLEIWAHLTIDSYGAPVNVDVNVSPFYNTRQLTTGYAVDAGDEHACTIQDNKTPKILDVPVFIPVWTYMLTDNLLVDMNDDENNFNADFRLSPNPVLDVAMMEFSDDFYVQIFDQMGKCVFQGNFPAGKSEVNLDLLPIGVYYIKASKGNKVHQGKIMKL